MQSHGLVEVKRWINLGGALTIIADSPTLRVTMTIAD